MNKTIQGILVALGLQIVGLIIAFLLFDFDLTANELQRTIADGNSFIFLAAMATIPNVLLFFYTINQNKINFAKGIQIVIILLVLVLAVLKFF